MQPVRTHDDRLMLRAGAACYPRWLGRLGTLAGSGWSVGAVLISFDVIIPFTVLAWAWMLGVGVAMWRVTS